MKAHNYKHTEPQKQMPVETNADLQLACGALSRPLPNRSRGNCAPRAFLRSVGLPYTPKDVTHFRRRLAAGCEAGSARYKMLMGKVPLAFDVGELQHTADVYCTAIALRCPPGTIHRDGKWLVFMPNSDCGTSFNDIPMGRRSFLCIKGTGHCRAFTKFGKVDLLNWQLHAA